VLLDVRLLTQTSQLLVGLATQQLRMPVLPFAEIIMLEDQKNATTETLMMMMDAHRLAQRRLGGLLRTS